MKPLNSTQESKDVYWKSWKWAEYMEMKLDARTEIVYSQKPFLIKDSLQMSMHKPSAVLFNKRKTSQTTVQFTAKRKADNLSFQCYKKWESICNRQVRL